MCDWIGMIFLFRDSPEDCMEKIKGILFIHGSLWKVNGINKRFVEKKSL